MCVVRDVVPHLVPAADEVPELCQVGRWAQIDEGVNFNLCRAESLWTSNMDSGEIYFLAGLQLVSCKFDIFVSASFQYLSECVDGFLMVLTFSQ